MTTPPPPNGQSRRRDWLPALLAVSLVTSTVAALAALGAFMSLGGQPASRTPPPTQAAIVSPTPSPSPPATPSPSPTAPPAVSLPPSPSPPLSTPSASIAPATTVVAPLSAEQAAAAFVDAWVRGDRPAAERVALPEAVDALFALPRPAAPPTFGSCDSIGTGQWNCSYFDGAGTFALVVIAQGDAFVVERAAYIPF